MLLPVSKYLYLAYLTVPVTNTMLSPGPSMKAQAVPAAPEDVHSEGMDSDHFSSNSSFLANEKLMSVDSFNSDITGMTLFPLQIYNPALYHMPV